MTTGQLVEDRVQRLLRQRRLQPAQGVIGAQFKDHRVGIARHRPVQPLEPPRHPPPPPPPPARPPYRRKRLHLPQSCRSLSLSAPPAAWPERRPAPAGQ